MTNFSLTKIGRTGRYLSIIIVSVVIIGLTQRGKIITKIKSATNHYWTVSRAPSFLYLISRTKEVDEVVKIPEIQELTTEAENLPDDLLIKPGRYISNGKAYILDRDGLYRWVAPGRMNAQRILWSGGNIDQLLNSLSVLFAHGSKHDKMDVGEILEIAMRQKVALTCSKQAEVATEILKRAGINARIVRFSSNREVNGYNDGHVMIEFIYKPFSATPVLYDIFNGVCFSGAGSKILDLSAFINSVRTHSVMPTKIANPITISSTEMFEYGYNFEFAVTYIRSAPKMWYEEICQAYIVSPWTGPTSEK